MEKEYKIRKCQLCENKTWFWKKFCSECETKAYIIFIS